MKVEDPSEFKHKDKEDGDSKLQLFKKFEV